MVGRKEGRSIRRVPEIWENSCEEWKRVLSGRRKRIRCRESLSFLSVQRGILQPGSAALLESEEEKWWGFLCRYAAQTKGQACWQRIVAVEMEGSVEVAGWLDFKILEIEYSKSWTPRRGEAPLCPMILSSPKVEDMLISLVRFQDID